MTRNVAGALFLAVVDGGQRSLSLTIHLVGIHLVDLGPEAL